MRKSSSVLLFGCLLVLLFISFQGCQQGDSDVSPLNIFRNSEILQKTGSFGKVHHRKRDLPEIDDSPLARIRQQGQVVLPPKDTFPNMSTSALLDTLHSYLGNIDVMCQRILRMGRVFDGGWEICDDEEYRPIRPCLVYSFGIQNDFSFDDYTANNYGCQVYSFDPSMEKEDHQRSRLVRFFKLGIDGEDTRIEGDSWQVFTVSTFKRRFGHSQTPLDVLKMDVEGTEWRALPQLIQSGEARHVRQLLVEFHTWTQERDNTLDYLKVLKDLYDVGFRKFYTHKNPGCFFERSDKFPVQRTFCYEVHYVNINFQS